MSVSTYFFARNFCCVIPLFIFITLSQWCRLTFYPLVCHKSKRPPQPDPIPRPPGAHPLSLSRLLCITLANFKLSGLPLVQRIRRIFLCPSYAFPFTYSISRILSTRFLGALIPGLFRETVSFQGDLQMNPPLQWFRSWREAFGHRF